MTKKTSKDKTAAAAPTDESTDTTSSKEAEKTRAASKDGSDDEEKPTATALTVDPSGGTSSKRPARGGSDKISPTSSGWGSVDSTPRSHGGGRDPGWGPPKPHPLEGDYVEEDYSKPNPLEGKPTKPFRDMNDDEKCAAHEEYCKLRGLDTEDEPYGVWELDMEKKERRRYNRSQRGPKEKKVTQAQYCEERVREKRKQREEESPDAFFARRKFDLERMDHFSQKAGGPALVMNDIPYPPITSMDRKELVKWKQLRDAYEDKLKAKAARMGHDWHKTAVGWIESTDRSVLKAVCAYVWKIKREDLYEDEYQDRIMEIIGQPASKWMVTKQDMETFCIRLRLDPTGDVVSRLVNYMEQVNNLIERHGLTKQLKMPGMMKSFIKVVASRVHPSVLRQHVEDQLKVSEADTLEKFADVLKEVMERMADAELMMGPHANGGHGRQKKRSQHELIDMIVPNRRPEGGYGKPAPVVRGYVPRADLGRTEDQPGWALRAGSSGSGGRKYEKPTNKYGPSTHAKNDGERDAKKAKLVPGRDATGAVKCYACGETGHFSRDCPSKTETERQESFKKGRNAVKRFKSKMKKASVKVQRAKAEEPKDGANWVLLNRALEVHISPWFDSACHCVHVDVNCAALGVDGDNMTEYLRRDVLGSSLLNVEFRRCSLIHGIPPSSLAPYQGLSGITITFSQMRQWNYEDGQSTGLPDSVTTLQIRGTALTQVPEILTTAPRDLVFLRLESSPIRTIPTRFFQAWTNVSSLSLTDLLISDVSMEIPNMRDLVWLELRGNRIATISIELQRQLATNTRTVKSIDLSANLLQEGPWDLVRTGALVDLSSNPLQDMPPSWVMDAVSSGKLMVDDTPCCNKSATVALSCKPKCAPQCQRRMLGNNRCDAVCLNPACAFDAGDCARLNF